MADLVDAMVQEPTSGSPRPALERPNLHHPLPRRRHPVHPAPDLLKALVSGVLKAVGQDASDFREVTLEANPEDMTKAQIQTWLGLGVTRLSLGVQSFHDETPGLDEPRPHRRSG